MKSVHMNIKLISISIILIVCLISFTNAIKIDNVKAKSYIEADSHDSPIRKYFSTKKILWTFDDYYIHKNHYPPHKGFDGLTSKITDYGGHVNIMVIFTNEWQTGIFQNEIRNYSVVQDFEWPQEKINKSLEFFRRNNIYPQCHGWNHSADLNGASLSEAYKIINFTLWNWKNNYDIEPNFFLGHGTSGNYNITLALKHFSDKYWNVYGENFRWYDPDLFPNPSRDAPAVEYIGKAEYVAMFDPCFGCSWGTPCETLKEAQDLFDTSSENKEIVFIRCHPSFLNDTDEETKAYLNLWEDWIDWIYQNHNLININHTQAIGYITDRYNFKLEKVSPDTFIIDLISCKFDHKILFTQPYDNKYYNWTLSDEKGKIIGEFYEDEFFELESGVKYSFSAIENIDLKEEESKIVDDEDSTPGFEILIFLFAIIFLYFLKIKKNNFIG